MHRDVHLVGLEPHHLVNVQRYDLAPVPHEERREFIDAMRTQPVLSVRSFLGIHDADSIQRFGEALIVPALDSTEFERFVFRMVLNQP